MGWNSLSLSAVQSTDQNYSLWPKKFACQSFLWLPKKFRLRQFIMCGHTLQNTALEKVYYHCFLLFSLYAFTVHTVLGQLELVKKMNWLNWLKRCCHQTMMSVFYFQFHHYFIAWLWMGHLFAYCFHLSSCKTCWVNCGEAWCPKCLCSPTEAEETLCIAELHPSLHTWFSLHAKYYWC